MDFFLAHSLGLLWLSVWTTRRCLHHPAEQLLAAGLLVWGNFTATSLILGLVNRPEDPAWILGISLVLALILMRGWPRTVTRAIEIGIPDPAPGKWLVLLVGLTLLPLAVCLFAPPYLAQPGEPELLNPTAWVLAGLGIYRFGQRCRLPPNTSLALSWIALVTGLLTSPPGTAAPAWPAIAGAIAGLVFAKQWLQSRGPGPASFAILAALLVVGGLSGLLLPNLRWAGTPPASPPSTLPAPDDKRVFAHDLILAPKAGPVVTHGLRPVEGPFPMRGLPRFRSVRQPGLRVVIPPRSGLTRLQIRFSLGLLEREKAEVRISLNGQPIKTIPLTRRGGWRDETLDLPALSAGNVIEFMDVPHQRDLDWRSYLERYQDVYRYLVTNNIPLEEGALQHYEFNGKPEGRLMTTREITSPAHGAYFFVFRQLQVEGHL